MPYVRGCTSCFLWLREDLIFGNHHFFHLGSFTIVGINVTTKCALCCADRLAAALWEVDGPEGSVTGVPNSMYLVSLSNSSELQSLPIT